MLVRCLSRLRLHPAVLAADVRAVAGEKCSRRAIEGIALGNDVRRHWVRRVDDATHAWRAGSDATDVVSPDYLHQMIKTGRRHGKATHGQVDVPVLETAPSVVSTILCNKRKLTSARPKHLSFCSESTRRQ